MKKKIALLLACVMAFGIAVGGTLAWLTDDTAPVVNTFTDSDINITLEEGVDTDKNRAESFKMIPGYEIAKDPKVTVLAGSEKCYLFVKLEKANNFDNFMTYEMADGWTALGDNYPGVYYREVAASENNQPFDVLKGDKVIVKDGVTKAMMDGLSPANYPKLTVTAYASQYNKNATTAFEPAVAWANIANPTATPAT